MYEVPVRIYNLSAKSRRISIKGPICEIFRIEFGKHDKVSQISPGLYIEFLVIYDKEEFTDASDKILISSENGIKIEMNLNARRPQPLVHFEPLINLGFVPVNTKKIEKIIFSNDGKIETKLELRGIDKSSDIALEYENFDLGKISDKNNKKVIRITYEPKEAHNLHEKIEVTQVTHGEERKVLGIIEIIATSVYQQLAIVFEEGGGPQTDINFGMVYYGQQKECIGYLVNNGPKEIFYNFFFHPGKRREEISLEESDFSCTPQQAGIEMTQRILSAEPNTGLIKPYDQIPIKFICKTKMPDNLPEWRGGIMQEYAYQNDKRSLMNFNVPTILRSTAAIKFEDASKNKSGNEEKICNPISVYMEVKAVYPEITLDKTMLNFWECRLHEFKIITLKIKNESEDLPVDFSFNKLPFFTLQPSSGVIYPNVEFPPITITFHPNNFGNFSDVLVLKYVNGIYEIPIRIMGMCNEKGKNTRRIRESEKTEEDFVNAIVPLEKALNFTMPSKKPIDQLAKIEKQYDARRSELNLANEEIIKNFENKFNDYKTLTLHKRKANQFLSEKRISRLQIDNEQSQLITNLVIDDNLKSYEGRVNLLDYLINQKENRISTPKFKLPEAKEDLWVLEPIGKYEPKNMVNTQLNKSEIFDPNKSPEEKYPNLIPTTHKEKRDCSMELNGTDLQNIIIGSCDIEFGDIFKNSEMRKTFWIKNNLRTNIFIQMELDKPELRRSYPTSMVIAPYSTQGFNLVIFSSERRSINFYLKYKINYKNSFKLRLTGNIVPVTLELRNQLVDFTFKSERYEKDKVDSSVVQKLKLFNGGNAPAVIKWDKNKKEAFKINPSTMSINPNTEGVVEISYTPIESGSSSKVEDILRCNIENGDSFTIPVRGDVPFSSVKLINPTNDILHFGDVNVGQAETRTFTLKNDTTKNPAAYIILNKKPGVISFQDQQGYIEWQKNITCTINCREENKNFDEVVTILIRAGPKIHLRITANVVLPNVYIEETNFDFGEVAMTESVVRTITFKNDSKPSAKIVINLDAPNLRDFKIEVPLKTKIEKGDLIKPVDENNNNVAGVMEEYSDDEEANDDLEESKSEIRKLELTLPGVNSNGDSFSYPVDFILCPSLSKGIYDFTTNFLLSGVGESPGLQRRVTAKIIDSHLHISRNEIEFKKTFIYGTELRFSMEEMKMSNLSTHKIHWEFLTDELEKEGVFMVKDKKGILTGNIEGAMCTVQFTFTPQIKKQYTNTVVLVSKTIDDNNQVVKETKKSIILRGVGALPRLYFDKRELILPVVPLGFESSMKFKIKNDGYENTKITHEIRSEVGSLPIKLRYLDDQTIGYMRQELRMEIYFSSPKPLSFTCKLVFLDEDGQEAIIMVAGTADNCLFTNYSFIQRNFENLEFYQEVDGGINLRNMRELETEAMEIEEKKSDKNLSLSFQGSGANKQSLAIGYTKIRKEVIDANCKYIKKYLKISCPDVRIKNFPEDIMQGNGDILFTLLKNFLGTKPPGKVEKFEEDPTRKSVQLRNQYLEVIKFLQERKAFLNTVFPEYMLDYSSFIKYINQDQNRLKIMEQNWMKNKQLLIQWQYINKESWTLLFYQILKIFYLSRVNTKTFPISIRHLSDQTKEKFSQLKYPPSNVYSNNEYILIRWLLANYEDVNKTTSSKQFKNFSSDLIDGQILSSLVLAYFPKGEEMTKTKKQKSTSEIKVMPYTNIIQILKDFGVFTHMKPKHFAFASDREMLLFLIMLYQNLQHFYRKEVVKFSCILGDSITKAISLVNSTNKLIEYDVKFHGSPDFILPNSSEIKLEPGSPEHQYPIIFKSRLTQEVRATVYFINKNYGWQNQAAPLVFELKSDVIGRRSFETYVIKNALLYKKTDFKFSVRSPFKEKGEFEMILIQQKKIQSPKKPVRSRALKPMKEEKKEEIQYKVFIPKGEDSEGRVYYKLEPDNARDITISFLPVDMDPYECHCVFIREQVGEFQITILAQAELPLPTNFEKWERTCEVDDVKELELDVKIKNKYLEEALSILKPIDNVENKNFLNKKTLTATNTTERFIIESVKPYFVVMNPNVLVNMDNLFYNTAKNTAVPAGISEKEKPNFADQMNLSNATGNLQIKSDSAFTFKVKFTSKVCQFYEGDFIIKNLDRPNDIRIYRLILEVKPKRIEATMEFLCPLKETIVQKIPINNSSDKDWLIRADLTGNTLGFFKHENEKRIAKKSSCDYILSFSPIEKIDVTAMLKLMNTFTKEVYEYRLIGRVDDPLAEDIIKISCNARELKSAKVKLDNTLERDVVYTVETDLPEIVSGLQSFVIKAQSSYNYEINVKPLLGKIYFGKITFTADDRKTYKWWTIQVEAKSTFQQSSVEMRTFLRKVIYIDVQVENPTNEVVYFHVEYNGEYLIGYDTEIRVEPYKTSIYQLYFSPLKVGVWEGSLQIYNEYIGEFLYKIKLISEENPPIYSDLLIAELGKNFDHPIVLENPIKEEIEVNYSNTNKRLYQVIPEKILLPPLTSKEIIIRYIPSTLDIQEECQIKFDTTKIGGWVFNFKGKGIPPTIMEPTYVNTFVGGITSGIINFKNPLNEKISVYLELKCPDWPNSFEIIKKKDRYAIEPFSTLPISFSFSPDKLTKYYADLYIYISKTLFWRYPIEGITEVKSKGVDYVFKTKAKKKLELKVNLELNSLPEGQINKDDFSFLINTKEEKYKSLIVKCFQANVDSTKTDNNNPSKLPLKIYFYPLRPFKTDCEFILTKKSGGQWIYNIILEATEPEPDDVINIQSSLGKLANVSFKLQNVFPKYSKFVAYFSHDSSSEFYVSPREGILDQSGREGTTFVVSYLPVEYGKVKIGKLIVETDEIQW